MPEPAAPTRSYRFDRFELQPEQRRLLDAGEPVPVNARAFDLLLALAERAGQLATKDELLRRVWGRLVVEEGNLQVQVSALRKIVGAGAIETIAGHGYRLTMEVEESLAKPEAARSARTRDLPVQLTEFLGRARELTDLRDILGRARLLTITGAGGIGKTRVALQLAMTVGDRFADGVRLVELAALTDARMVPNAVAAALGIPEEPGRAIDDTVLDRVRDRRILIVLDNCEHLLDACAGLARRLLQTSPLTTVLATSREPLHLAGESIYALGPLTMPGPKDPIEVEHLQAFDAIRLFEVRATDVQPTFTITSGNAEAVAGICRRLDGIPLALELAAARLRSITVEAIAERLRDRFRLLAGKDRTAEPRQQTLRATIEWSHDLLTSKEQALLRRLAVFADGWTLEAAEGVASIRDLPREDVLDLLCNLVDKSLVVLEGERYRMLETVREYARERLAESDEESSVRGLHLEFYSALAEGAERQLYGPDQRAWRRRFDSERENILLAIAQSRGRGYRAEAGLKILYALRPWLCGSRLELTHRLCMEALAHPNAHAETVERGQACSTAGSVCYFLGRYEDSLRWGEESLRLAEKHGDILTIIDTRTMLGNTMLGLADTAAAQDHCVGALELALKAGDIIRTAYASNALGEVYATTGRHDLAESHYARALELFRDVGNRDDAALALLNLARTSIARSASVQAARFLLDVRELLRERTSVQWENVLLALCMAIAASRSDGLRAARFYGAAEMHRERSGYRREPADEAFLAPIVARARADAAPGTFEAAEAEGRSLDSAKALDEAKSWLETLV